MRNTSCKSRVQVKYVQKHKCIWLPMCVCVLLQCIIIMVWGSACLQQILETLRGTSVKVNRSKANQQNFLALCERSVLTLYSCQRLVSCQELAASLYSLQCTSICDPHLPTRPNCWQDVQPIVMISVSPFEKGIIINERKQIKTIQLSGALFIWYMKRVCKW